MLIDTHCHIHESDYPLDSEEVIKRAHEAGVMQMICAGSNAATSKEAVEFASKHEGVFASVGVHPHFAKDGLDGLYQFIDSVDLGNGFALGSIGAPAPDRAQAAEVSLNQGDRQTSKKVVAIGEIGLDYYYANSSKEDQIKALEEQINLAQKLNLPVIFHVRDAYDDFWPVLDNFRGVRGVLHSFTDTIDNMEQGLKRGFYFGINGISTFTKIEDQKAMFAAIPVDKIMLETDAPFLTPYPLRGKIKINEPAFVREIAVFNSSVRQISIDEFAEITTANARTLFNL